MERRKDKDRLSLCRAGIVCSYVVLPHENMRGDPGQEYFNNGFTEHVIISL